MQRVVQVVGWIAIIAAVVVIAWYAVEHYLINQTPF
jgi:hypothetical protein